MEIERDGDFLEEVSENYSTELFDEDTVNRGQYISGEELVNLNLPNESKAWYYGEQAADRGNLEKIREYMEPVGYEIDFSEDKSKLLGTTSDAAVFIIDISLVQLLAQGNTMGRIPGKHTFEILVIGDSKMKSELKEGLREVLDS